MVTWQPSITKDPRRRMLKNNLVYIPSDVYLTNAERNASNCHKLTKPGYFFVVKEHENHYKIFAEGKQWFVEKKYIYEVRENSRG